MMLQYPRLAALVRAVDPRSPNGGFMKEVVPYLVDLWFDHYAQTSSHRMEALKRPLPNILICLTLPVLA